MSGPVIGLWLAVLVLVGSTLFPFSLFGRGSALFNLILMGLVGAGLYYLGSIYGVDDRLALAAGDEAARAPPASIAPADIPPPQAALLAAVGKGRDAYLESTNDMARGAARPVRAQEVCAALSGRVATDWVGLVSGLSSRPDGRGVLSIDLGERVAVTTRTNADSDRQDKTLIEPGSPVFRQAASLRVGQKVRFSGRFAPSDTDCLKEGSLTLAASMQRPEYLLVFTAIEPWEATPLRRDAVRAE